MAVVSAIDVYTIVDEAGNPRTTGWFDFEFRENYLGGGIAADLSPYFRSITEMMTRIASGATLYNPVPNETTFSTPTSTLIKLMHGGASGHPMFELASGTAVSGTRAKLLVIGY